MARNGLRFLHGCMWRILRNKELQYKFEKDGETGWMGGTKRRYSILSKLSKKGNKLIIDREDVD